MRGFESDEKMNVIRDTTDALWGATRTTDGSTQILVQTRAPFHGDDGFPVFRGKDNVVEERGVRGWHEREALAPLPGCGLWCGAGIPVVSLRSTTGYRLRCLWHRCMNETGASRGVFFFYGCERLADALQ